jgi:hypothetical protein
MLIPAFDHGFRLGPHDRVGNLPHRIDGNVQVPRPHAHAAVSLESGRAPPAVPANG